MLLGETLLTFQPPVISGDIIIIVGGYGSGKSEVSVNLSRHLISGQPGVKLPITIVDLDIVNPYFRSREATEELEALGVRTIHPKGEQRHADLPIVLPNIKSGLLKREGTMVLDVGGDDVGARVLSSLADAFTPGEYELLFVINGNRPFTSTADGCIKVMNEIEVSSRLKFTGLIANTHLLEDTDEETVLAGLTMAHEVGDRNGLPISFLSALGTVLEKIDTRKIDVPVLPLTRSLLKPWEKKD